MAKSITRNGITYRCERTYEFDENGEFVEREGGEIEESDVDSILEAEAAARENDEYEAQLDKEEQEWENIQTPSKNKRKRKNSEQEVLI